MHLAKLTIHSDRFPDKTTYPFRVPLFQNTKDVVFTSNVIFFSGENGSGKSTLLRAIAKKCGIHIWAEECWTRAHYNQYEEQLFQYVDISWTKGTVPGAFFSAETYDHMSRMIDLWASGDPGLLNYFGGSSLLELSHGESFMSFFRSRYAREGLYLLDEPETALSPKHQLEFASFLNEMGSDGHAQFIIATHSPLLMSCPLAAILSFDTKVITPIKFIQTEHFKVYREFFSRMNST
jgi:predicted ATPase